MPHEHRNTSLCPLLFSLSSSFPPPFIYAPIVVTTSVSSVVTMAPALIIRAAAGVGSVEILFLDISRLGCGGDGDGDGHGNGNGNGNGNSNSNGKVDGAEADGNGRLDGE